MEKIGPGTGTDGGPEQLVGSLFAERYRLVRMASAGANTLIFDADDTASGRPVTLKIVQPSLAEAPDFSDRFDRAIRSVAAISHANIAAIYDWGEAAYGDATAAYVVIERLAGGSLRDMFDRGRRLSPSQALMVGLDACRALDYAHRRGFVHRELTPSKLVFGDDRRLRIVDFGLAELLSERAWREPATVATHVARYASPEQALSLPIDGKSDVYALCLVIVEAVTGALPFSADSTVATLSARVGRLMPVSADLGPLASVLEHAGRPEPEDRSSAAEFGRGLVHAAEKLPRPEPLPLLSSGMFDVPLEQLRNPDDPTGGVVRPGAPLDAPPDPHDSRDAPTELLVVPLDEPDGSSESADETEPGADGIPPAEPVPTAETGETRDDGEELTIVPIDVDDDDAGRSGATAAFDSFGSFPEAAGRDDLVIRGGTETVDDLPASAVAAPDGGPGTWEGVAPVPRRRRRVPWKLIVPLLVVIALAGLAVLAWQLFSTPAYAVPDLVGVEEPVARNQITGNGWEISVQRERSDEEPRAGHVIRTAPVAGEELAEGEPFLIVVSEGPTFRELPELTGRPFADVETELARLDLVVELVEQNDEAVPSGTVVSWSVPDDPTLVAGSQVLPGRTVRVVASLGPAPRVVPDLSGQTFAAAQGIVEPLALGVSEAERVFSDTVPVDVVISQTPAAGTEVERGAGIVVVVSKGPDVVTMPNLAGMTFEAASAALTEAGFVPVLSFGTSDGTLQSATVAGATAHAGDVFPRGTQVDLVYL
ncbi:MAG: PASTA domain-containing protein [Ilumatobacteraceae bacterium]